MWPTNKKLCCCSSSGSIGSHSDEYFCHTHDSGNFVDSFFKVLSYLALSLSDFFAEQERDIGGRSQKCFKNEPYAWLQNTHTQQIVNIRSFYGPPRVFEAEAICYNKAMKIRYCRHLTNRICIFLRLGPPCLLASQFQVCQRGDNMIMIFKPFVMHANSFKAEIRNFNLSNRAKVR